MTTTSQNPSEDTLPADQQSAGAAPPVLNGWGRVAEATHERLAAEYLEPRGTTLPAFLAAGGEVVADASRLDPAYGHEPALVWRFFDPAGRSYGYDAGGIHQLFHRVRLLGRRNTFLQPRGSGTHVYYVRHPNTNWPTILADPDYGLILSEGETRALAGAERDLPVISLTGVDCWHLKGEHDIHPDLAGIEWKNRLVYLAFDSDAAHKEGVQHALSQLAACLRHRGAEVWQVRIPAAPDGTKQGLDDYLARYGADAFHALSRSDQTVQLRPSDADFFDTADNASEAHTVAELLGREVKPVEELIPGWIERGIPNWIAGPGGTNKSRLALQWGLCLNAGASVWGINATLGGIGAPRATLVYCSAEDDADELARRAQAISRVLKLKKPDKGQLLVRRGMDSALVVMKESGGVEVRPFYHELITQLQSIAGHKIVVLDSAYDFVRFTGRAKIDEDSVNFFIKVVLQSLCDRADCTLMIPWHPSQAGSERESMDGWSVAWHNAPRARLALKASKDVPDTYELSVTKRNHGPKGQTVMLRFHEGAMLPIEAVPDDGKAAVLRRCVVEEAIRGAEVGVPFTQQRGIPTGVLKTVSAATGTDVTNKAFKDELESAVRDGGLRYVKGYGKTRAGYYPNVDDAQFKKMTKAPAAGGHDA